MVKSDQNRNKSPEEEIDKKIKKFLRVKNRATLKVVRGTICECGTKDSALEISWHEGMCNVPRC